MERQNERQSENSGGKREKVKSIQQKRRTALGSVLPLSFKESLDEHEKNLPKKIKENIDFIYKKYGVKVEFFSMSENKKDLYHVQEANSANPDRALALTNYLRVEMSKLPKVLWQKFQIKKMLLDNGDMKDTRNYEIAGVMEQSGVMSLGYGYPLYHELFHRVDHLMKQDISLNQEADLSGMEYDGRTNNEHYRELAERVPRAQAVRKMWKRLAILDGEENVSGGWDYEEVSEDRANVSASLFDETPKKKTGFPLPSACPNRAERLRAEIKEWSDGLLDERYWTDLRAGKVDENYWKNRGY